jgi:hypothetical protein
LKDAILCITTPNGYGFEKKIVLLAAVFFKVPSVANHTFTNESS